MWGGGGGGGGGGGDRIYLLLSIVSRASHLLTFYISSSGCTVSKDACPA